MRRWSIPVALGAIALVVLLFVSPRGALVGWRAAFVAGSAVPIGAVVLLLIARLTGADWDAALVPLTALLPALLPGFIPVVVAEALFVPHAGHLSLYLAWPLFALRGGGALVFWWWLAHRLRRDRLTVLGAGLALLAHGILVTFIATDWLLGTAPGQPNSAIAMALTALQIGAAAGAACLLKLGPEHLRRDLSSLLVAGCLGLGYLLFMDYLIVWFGNLPSRVGWYGDRRLLPWSAIPPLAVLLGIVLPIGFLVRAASHPPARRLAAGSALAAFLLVSAWEVAAVSGWLGLGAAVAAGAVVAPMLARSAAR